MTYHFTESLEEIFSQLPPQDEQILFSLPYRVGLYVSYADVSGGWDAQEKELQSLSGILREFSEDFYKTELAQKILMECLFKRASWPSWSQNIDAVLSESEKAVASLSPLLSEADLESFKQVLVEIALAVAMAFRETHDRPESPSGGHSSLVREFLDRLTGARRHADPLSHMNISGSEREALIRLCAALDYSFQNA